MRKIFKSLIFIGGVPVFCGTAAAAPQEDVTRPNVLVIMTDQQQGKALGCLGEVPVKTPNLDRLAEDGVVFTNAVSNYPVSSPARGMFMTGMYPLANHVTANCYTATAPYGVELSQDAVCWSDCLKSAGYSLGYLGKWHLDAPHKPYVSGVEDGEWNEWCPPERRHGFDYWEAYGTYNDHFHPMYWSTDAARDEHHIVDEWSPTYEAGKAIDFIKDHISDPEKKSKPFGLMISINPPHHPYRLVPQKYVDMYKDLDVESLCTDPKVKDPNSPEGKAFRRDLPLYYANITGMDDQVGRIIDYLQSAGLYENTLIVFISDHGDFVGAMGNEHKNFYHEDSMRIPLIMTWPAKLKHRVDDETLFGIADFYPTLLTMLGLGDMIPEDVQSFDHGDYILRNKVSRATSWQPYYKFQNNPSVISGMRGIRGERYTYVARIKDAKVVEEMLFDRKKDPYQENNVVAEHPKIVSEMRAVLKRHLKSTDDPAYNAFTPEGYTPVVSGYASSNTLRSDYHLYSLVWEEDRLVALFDNEPYFIYERPANYTDYNWPFEQPFFLILNIAVGGSWGGDVDNSVLPQRMEVEYVRYYHFKQ